MRVLTFGTFDLFHKGHEYYLSKSKELGSELHVVVALDETVKKIKGFYPDDSQTKRLGEVSSKSYVTKAHLGSPTDKYAILDLVKPDFICLGYDQKDFIENLEQELQKRGLMTKIIRIQSYKPEVHKSSHYRLKKQSF